MNYASFVLEGIFGEILDGKAQRRGENSLLLVPGFQR